MFSNNNKNFRKSIDQENKTFKGATNLQKTFKKISKPKIDPPKKPKKIMFSNNNKNFRKSIGQENKTFKGATNLQKNIYENFKTQKFTSHKAKQNICSQTKT